ncbi:MAG: FHA domain-containing protein [Anaerolineae bacterium]|nr:FHA domain-containing protein [Anaerolineae bacterium]MDW8172276.1 FHA domain-containing protein [Anaerolineae bacterium]
MPDDPQKPAKTSASDETTDVERKSQTNYLNLRPSADAPSRAPSTTTKYLSDGWRVSFKIGTEIIYLPDKAQITIGRAPEPDNEVELDLSKFGALPLGVSRHHARISVIEGLLYLRDLQSTNGTRINGFQVTPNQDYRLRDGDEIELGRLRLILKYERLRTS